MSLFIGKDNYGDSILHISKNITNESSMKNGIINGSTIFHSSHYPLCAEKFELTSYQNHTDFLGNNYRSFELPLGFIQYCSITQYKSPIIIIINGNQVLSTDFYYSDFMQNDGGTDIHYGETPVNTNTSLHIYNKLYLQITSIVLLVLNINIETGRSAISYPSARSIFLNKNSFIVNGVDITYLKFLTIGYTNYTDYTFNSLQGTIIQLVNSSHRTGISINGNGSSFSIKTGENTIINSSSGFLSTLPGVSIVFKKDFVQNETIFYFNNSIQDKYLYNLSEYEGRLMIFYIKINLTNGSYSFVKYSTVLQIFKNTSILVYPIFAGNNYGYLNIYLYIDNSLNVYLRANGGLSQGNSGYTSTTNGMCPVSLIL